jgi:glycosyltransferase involved in cell wall biosynthesis
MKRPDDVSRVFMLASTLVTGGAERVFESLAKGLPSRGYLPEVICLHDPGSVGRRLSENGVRVTHGMARSKYDPVSIFRIFRIFSGDRNGVFLSLDHHDAIAIGITAARMACLKGRILSLHSTGLWGRGSSFTRFDRLFLNGFGKIIALAQMHRDYLIDSEGLDPGRISVINNGVDTEIFRPAAIGEKEELRMSLGIDEKSFAVLMVAALRPEKNHSMFLEAAAILNRGGGGKFKFLLAGAGSEEKRLKRISSNLGLDRSIRFLGDREDIELILRAADASVLCSFPVVETFPLAVLEGMAAGLPVISTGVGSVPEIIEDGVDGIIIESGDTERLAAEIARLERDRSRSADIGSRAREKAEDRFSVKVMVDSYADLIDEMQGAREAAEKR